MIEVNIKPNEVVITGHSDAEHEGDESLCCSVRTLYYSLVANLLNVTDRVDYDGIEGYARVKCKEFSQEVQGCFKFFEISIKYLADNNPNDITLVNSIVGNKLSFN